MGIKAKIDGVSVDIIRCFAENVLVQEPNSQEIYLVGYEEFDPDPGVRYNRDSSIESNVVSLEDWKRRWQKKKLTQQRKKRLV